MILINGLQNSRPQLTNLKKAKHQQRNYQQPKHWLVAFVSFSLAFSGCAHSGPDIFACVVDAAHDGFQCADNKKKWFISIKEGEDLECISPSDLEDFLKACKEDHRAIPVTLCRLDLANNDFECSPPVGVGFIKSIVEVDNYFCVTEQSKKRIIQRCK